MFQEILDIFKNCSFEDLNDKNYKKLILNNLPSTFEYTYAYGASKLVIIPKQETDYVIKIPFEGYVEHNEFYSFTNANWDNYRNWDYCLTEVLNYHCAKKNKVERVLAKTRLIGEVNNHPIYIQERAMTYEDAEEDKVINDIRSTSRTHKICSKKHYKIFNLDWITDVYNYYGKRRFDKIMSFVETIGDLHDDNIGYIGSRPVLVDYSDFMS